MFLIQEEFLHVTILLNKLASESSLASMLAAIPRLTGSPRCIAKCSRDFQSPSVADYVFLLHQLLPVSNSSAPCVIQLLCKVCYQRSIECTGFNVHREIEWSHNNHYSVRVLADSTDCSQLSLTVRLLLFSSSKKKNKKKNRRQPLVMGVVRLTPSGGCEQRPQPEP